jgi:hypothetical protein
MSCVASFEEDSMACSMAITPTSQGSDFLARTGQTISLSLRAQAGVVARLLSIQYADQPVDVADPFQFIAKAGLQSLVITYSASQPGAQLQLVELCGQQIQPLRNFFFDPNAPAKGFAVAGV